MAERPSATGTSDRVKKTVLSGTGKLGITVPRDRQANFEPQLIAHVSLRAGAVRVARSSTSFQPGTSGNPGGRPKGLSEVIALAREHTVLAITTLVDIAKQTALRD